MKTISCFNDLLPFGINPLTGEACGLSYRILCDVTEPGRKILAKALGIPRLALPEAWNRGGAADPHVGSVMLPFEMLTPLAVFSLLESGCTQVWLVRDGGVIGIEPGDSPEMIEANRLLVGDRLARTLGYRGTASGGDRNVHMMSGRVE
jgi:hypothetical protein